MGEKDIGPIKEQLNYLRAKAHVGFDLHFEAKNPNF